MTVIDLTKRVTGDWERFSKYVRSSDSLVFFENGLPNSGDFPSSVDLFVGDRWFSPTENAFRPIDEDGVHVRPNAAIVIQVNQKISLPHNVIGFVTGKGKFIFQAAVISPGKIDPGFDGKLRIGFFNAGKETVVLKPNEPFCSCCFIQVESEAENPRQAQEEPPLQPAKIPWYWKLAKGAKDNWKVLIPIGISILALVVSFIRLALVW